MKNEPLFKLIGAAMLAAVILAFATAAKAAEPAPAGHALRDGTTVTVRRSGGIETRTRSRSTPSGDQVVSESQRTWDKASRAATITGWSLRPDGTKLTFQKTVTRIAPGSFRETGTVTGPDGRQRSITATRTRVSPGMWQIQRTITDANGRTTEQTIMETRSRGLVTRMETIRHPDGSVTTRTSQSPAHTRQDPGAAQ
jgi:hypothetical protein